MDMFDFAGMLFGRAGTSQAHSVTASGAAASDDGVASITLDADVTPAEDVGEDADQTIIDLPTSPDVDEGDELIVTLVGDGPLKTPIVTANPGAGDRMRAAVTSARSVADAAQAVAEAVNQHFFADTSGIHVTEATQEGWNDNHSGANVLINSIGQLFRDGLTNLLAILTTGVAIYDGNGNDAENITASFTGSGVTIGSEYNQDYHNVIDSNGLSIWAKRAANLTRQLVMRFNRDGITFAEDREHRLSLYNILHEIVANAAGLHLYAYGDPVEDSPVARIDLNATAGATSGNGSIKFTLGNTSGAHVVTVPNATGTLALDTVATANLSRGSGASSWSSGQVRRGGKVVTVTINGAKLASALASGSTSGTIATIPDGYRPPAVQRVPACIDSGGNYGNAWFAIGASGTVQLANRSSVQIPTSVGISCNVTYIID